MRGRYGQEMPRRPRHPSRAFAPVALLAALILAVGAQGAAAATAGGGALTPELEQLATPALAAQPAPAQAAALGLPAEGPGSLAREGERVIVEARFESGALAGVEALRDAGARILVASRRYQTVALAVQPADLEAIAAVPGVAFVTPSRRPVLYGVEGAARTAAVPSNGLCEGGSVISEGLGQLNVPAARAAFGTRGAGETIGVLSDSFNSATTAIGGGPIATNAHADEVSNDLPGRASTCSGQQVPVRVLAEAPPPASGEQPLTDEGRAMLQVIHDLAPQAELAFATAIGGELAFARNIERLAEPVSAGGGGASVIVDDVGYPAEPFFQEGPVAVAIQKVTAAGVTYLTAAGNENVLEAGTGKEIGSWEAARYKPIACPAPVDAILPAPSTGCMNFDPTGSEPNAEFGMTVEPGSEALVDLQWAEPWFGVHTDLDAYLLSASGEVLSESAVDSIEAQVPVELLGWENTTGSPQDVYLVINRCSGVCNLQAGTGTPRLKFVLLGGGVSSIEYPQSAGEDVVGPTIYGHAGSPAAITLGAVNYRESAAAPSAPEPYSSRGPVAHYFGSVTSTAPAAALPTPARIAKPNLTATDCASTTFFARFEAGAWHFCGTSEAAPHAAAVAALMKESDPPASPGAIVAAMESSATKYTTVTRPEAVGAGLLNAAGALQALGGRPVESAPSWVVPSLEEEEKAGPPSVRITNGPGPLSSNSRPTFEFTSSRPVAFTCQLDGGAPQPCASPYLVPAKLADGAHGFAVTGRDAEGRSATSGVYAFTIDTKAPRTKIVGHPKKVVTTRKRSVVLRFRLWASESPVTYYCQFDKEPLRICGARFKHRFKQGRHAVRVRAKDQAGNIADKPTVFHFRVKELSPKHRAKTSHRPR